jgi:DNA-binding Lrp family transcriptional regulator
MARAFVLIKTHAGKVKDVAAILEGEPGIESINIVTGPYDIIAVVERKALSEIGDLITSKIHTFQGVVRTVTCLVV